MDVRRGRRNAGVVEIMNIFKRIAKGINKAAKTAGKIAPKLILEGLNLGSGGTLGIVAEALGVGTADPEVVEKHLLAMDPAKAIDLLIEKEKSKQESLKAIVDDRKDARSLNKEYVKSGRFWLQGWMPFYTLAVLTILCWMFYEVKYVEEGKRISEAVLVIVGVFVSQANSLGDFWTGHSKKTQEQDFEVNKGML